MVHMRTFVLICLGLLGLIAMPGSAPEAAVPQLINYQGRLTGPEGKPPTTGDYTLSFSIYDKPVGPSCASTTETDCARRIWGPQVFDGKSDVGHGHGAQVPVVKGFFNVLLGPYDIDGDPIAQAFTGSNRFVEVTVEDGQPNLPRQQVFSAPYALTSMGEIPVGGIIMWSGKSSGLPDNWKICNGRRVLDPESPFNGKTLPDLRARFVRGAGSSSEVLWKGGSDVRDTHNHSFSGSITIGMNRSSLNGYRIRSIFCDDDNENGICDGDIAGNSINLIGGGFTADSRYRALVLDVKKNESHGHKGTVTGGTSWDKNTNLDNRPPYINLHYIIRIK